MRANEISTSFLSHARWVGVGDDKEDTCLVTARGSNRAPDMHREGIQGFRTDCGWSVEQSLATLRGER